MREHGTAANQVLWRGQTPLLGDADYTDQAIVAMDKWLAAIEADKRDVPLARKIIQDKPKDLGERCTDGAPGGSDLPAETCDATVQSYSTPRIEAGMPQADDTIKCELQPLRRDGYGAIQFTDAQFAQLQAAFPTGVCDYSKPGVDRTPTVPWLSYADGPGGRPLGPTPRSASFGCLARRSPVGTRNVGRVRLRASRRGLGPPCARPGHDHAALVALVRQGRGRKGLRRLHGQGTRRPRGHDRPRARQPPPAPGHARPAGPRPPTGARRSLGRDLFRAGPRSTRLDRGPSRPGPRRRRGPRGLIARPKLLRRYLRLAGL